MKGETARKTHTLITQFFNAKDPQDKTIYRNKFIPAYWDLELSIAQKIANSDFPLCKKLLLRFGILSPTFISTYPVLSSPIKQGSLSIIWMNGWKK